ncbi:unnamed protein product [Arabis nemorensis]|uniref:Uncharacterized protein n=1 Tax=Arabis nemorensis TaxID=586526 RepID=A0A565CP44_9BRAS|nr:unnamed protein product [Arabis nemorensis]
MLGEVSKWNQDRVCQWRKRFKPTRWRERRHRGEERGDTEVSGERRHGGEWREVTEVVTRCVRRHAKVIDEGNWRMKR